jgi:ribosomal protein S18 acetylase RimI-like enzyme
MVADPPILIRAATSRDFPACAAFDPLLARGQRRGEDFRAAVIRRTAHIAEAGDLPVGYSLLHFHFFGRAFIDLVMVHPDWRRRGVGRALVESWYPRVQERGGIFTSTNASNTPMQRLLLRLGFEPSGIIHNLDPDDPEIIYLRALPVRVPIHAPAREAT